MRKILILIFFIGTMLFGSIDLNSATKEQLMQISGIGAKKAMQIIKFRENRSITKPEDLLEIKGFGPKLIEKIKNNLKK